MMSVKVQNGKYFGMSSLLENIISKSFIKSPGKFSKINDGGVVGVMWTKFQF